MTNILNINTATIISNPLSPSESKEGNLVKTPQNLSKIRKDYSISTTDYEENE